MPRSRVQNCVSGCVRFPLCQRPLVGTFSFTFCVVPGKDGFQGAFASEDVQTLTGGHDDSPLTLCCLMLMYTADWLLAVR